jgi:hypothetical protein
LRGSIQGQLWAKSKTLSKKNKVKSVEGVAQVVDHLSSKQEALSSNLSTAKRKKKNLIFMEYTIYIFVFLTSFS